jgi:hypothetical protein
VLAVRYTVDLARGGWATTPRPKAGAEREAEPRRHPLTSAIRKTSLLPALGLGRRAEAMVVSRRWCLLFDMVVGGLRGFFARPSSTQRRGG